jgi:type IV pilus assembly protein PilB
VTPKVNVLTVEDPVEYLIKGVRQIKLSHRLDMEGALRSILRHDPDIVMVGEMRDRETAELAIKLANTGHLTFSTLHTNDATSAVSRLYKMGIEPFLLAYAINLVVAQRLIRRLCADCKEEVPAPDAELLNYMGFSEKEISETRFYDSGDSPECEKCRGAGYRGRRAIAETLYFTDEIRKLILVAGDVIDEDSLRQQALSQGMLTLRQSAKEMVKEGDTSVAEMIRVTGSA